MTLDKFVDLVPVATRAPAPAKASNVLLLAAAPPDNVRHGVLQHKDAGPAGGAALPDRVVAVLGPGATFNGLAALLLPRYPGTGGTKAPTADELAKALVVYNRNLLPAGTWAEHRVGLCLPLPIEVDQATRAWTVNADDIRTLARAFDPTWLRRLTVPPAPLTVPEPAQIEGEARIARRLPVSLPGRQWERVLHNPSEAVLEFREIVSQLGDDGPTGAEQRMKFLLAFLDLAKPHHVEMLAATRAGNATLRRIDGVLQIDPPPAGTDAAKLAGARLLVAKAIFKDPTARRDPVPHHEVPETADLLAVRGLVAKTLVGAKTDPAGGLHRLVFGRDVAAGRDAATRVGTGTGTTAVNHTGPVFTGRLALDPFLEDDAVGLNRGHTADRDGRLALLSAYGVGGGPLDAVKVGGAGVMTVGLGAWPILDPTGAVDPKGLADLLSRYRTRAFDEFELFFRMHGLDVEPGPGANPQPQLKAIGPDGTTSTVLSGDALVKFFGGTIDAKKNVTFGAEWAARFRLVALVSRQYRRTQVLKALDMLTPDPIALAIAAIDPFPTAYKLEFDQGPGSTSEKLAAQVNAKVAFLGGLPATTRSRGTLAGAVVDLTGGPAKPAYAGFHDTETFFVGSMAKAAALYAAFELRYRLRKALNAAIAKGLDVTKPGWDVRFRTLVRDTWSGRVGRGFPGFDTTMPNRFPKLDKIFEFTGAVTPPAERIELTKAPAGDFSEQVTEMILLSHAAGAAQVIDRIGFPYLNGALRQGGFFDPGTDEGIWLSTNYLKHGDWMRDKDPKRLSARGILHYKDTTNVVGNAKQFARLLTLVARGELFEKNDALGCQQMIEFMRKDGVLPDGCFINLAVAATPEGTPQRPVGAGPLVPQKFAGKIGIGDARPGDNLNGISDCAIFERHKGAPAPAGVALRYVMVFVGGYSNFHLPQGTGDPETGTYFAFVQALDSAVDARH